MFVSVSHLSRISFHQGLVLSQQDPLSRHVVFRRDFDAFSHRSSAPPFIPSSIVIPLQEKYPKHYRWARFYNLRLYRKLLHLGFYTRRLYSGKNFCRPQYMYPLRGLFLFPSSHHVTLFRFIYCVCYPNACILPLPFNYSHFSSK